MKKTLKAGIVKFVLFFGLLVSVLHCTAQFIDEEPQVELAWGIKVVTGEIIYGKKSFYTTDPTSIGLQSGIRYDVPVKLFTKRFVPHYIDVVYEAGFLFCKARVFDTTFYDPNTNIAVHDRSSNATYFPVYFGVYNRSALSIGAQVFYWKGLGARDIWGAKFLSLGYNARNFRLTASGELYAQVSNRKHSGTIFSFEFLWKLIKER